MYTEVHVVPKALALLKVAAAQHSRTTPYTRRSVVFDKRGATSYTIHMLYILRHGQTEWNARGKLQGKTDVPLCGEGKKSAEEEAKRNADIRFDVCYCSPLLRARRTAEIFLKGKNVPVIADERLTEMGFGIYEGTENALNCTKSPLRELFTDPQNYIPDGGAESFDSLFKRTGEFLEQVALPLSNAGKSVLIVGHGAMNAAIICRIKGIPLNGFWSALTENCRLLKLI